MSTQPEFEQLLSALLSEAVPALLLQAVRRRGRCSDSRIENLFRQTRQKLDRSHAKDATQLLLAYPVPLDRGISYIPPSCDDVD